MHRIVTFALVLCLFSSGALAQQATIQVNANTALQMSNFYQPPGPAQLTTVNPIFGYLSADTTNGQVVPMYPDLTFNDVYIPQGSTSSFVCTVNTGCSAGAATQCMMYNSPNTQNVACNTATTTMRFSNQPPQDGKTLPTMNFKLVTSEATGWSQYNLKNGVWGLAPNSPFWQFFWQGYSNQGSNSVSIMYKIDDDEVEYQTTPSKLNFNSNSYVTVNGRYTSTKQVSSTFKGNQGIATLPFSWANSRISPYAGNDKDNAQLCIDNTIDAFFILNSYDYDDTMTKLSNQLCNEDSGCNLSNSQFENVDNLKIVLKSDDGKEDVTITIGAKDFISYAGEGSDDQRMANLGIAPMNSSSACYKYSNDTKTPPQNAFAYGLGRLFLTKAELQMTQVGPNEFRLSFSQIPRPTNVIYPILMIISAAIVLIAIVLIVIFNLPKKEPVADEGYKTA